MKIHEVVARDLSDEPQSVVKVYETGRLKSDITEYVLTDRLAEEFAKVMRPVVDAGTPAFAGTDRIGVWVSGFFGSGKSHFAKIAGHLLADTTVGDTSARRLFGTLIKRGRQHDEELAELFQEAANYKLSSLLVPFDITALHTAAAEGNVALTFLRAFYQALGLSKITAFAELELILKKAGVHDQLPALYLGKAGVPWDEDRDFAASSSTFADCLTELLPTKYPTSEKAFEVLEFAQGEDRSLNIDKVVDKLISSLDQSGSNQRLVFVADEVGAWAKPDLKRIEQIRALAEVVASKGKGRIWIIATSQEKLSAIVQNAPTIDAKYADELLERLEARFKVNVHLESSEVGEVIETRILSKKPTAHEALSALWSEHQSQLADIAEPPGLKVGSGYPAAEHDSFIDDYPFLPYQLQAASDIFGGMRGVKVSSGARSMIKVAFDALRDLKDEELGKVVSWDQIFDSANQDNEFADEQYLGSQGLTYIASADKAVVGTPIVPSRLLKVLWLVGRSASIPRSAPNLARLLVDDLAQDVLQLEQNVETTLQALSQSAPPYVRQDTATGQWRFLTLDQVTIEQVVDRITKEMKQKAVRDEIFSLFTSHLQTRFPGRITVGKTNTPFTYGTYFSGTAIKNEASPVQLHVSLANTETAQRAAESNVGELEGPLVHWVIDPPESLEVRLRRAIAIAKLPADEEYQRVATDRTRREAENLQLEADELNRDAAFAVERVLEGGRLLWSGDVAELGSNGDKSARASVEDALRKAIQAKYSRFKDGDKPFKETNIPKLFTAAPKDRGSLDPDLNLFSPDGHLHGNSTLVEAISRFLTTSMKTTGSDLAGFFGDVPYGWQADLLRYVVAAMLVDGKVVADSAGKTYDNPRDSATQKLFGTAQFRSTRFLVEENPLTPAELSAAGSLLVELRLKSNDGSEIGVRDAVNRLANDLSKRQLLVERAKQAGMPLPAEYEQISTMLDEITQPGSRAKVIRSFIEREQALRKADQALAKLEEFDRHHGLSQYQRAGLLADAVHLAGLDEDPNLGERITNALEQLDALRTQARVLEEWDGAFVQYQSDLIDAFQSVYAPLRQDLHNRVGVARARVESMVEYEVLSASDKAKVRAEFFGTGKPFALVSVPELHDAQQLIAANAEYSVNHLRAALSAIDRELSGAESRVLGLHGEEMKRRGEEAKTERWSPSAAFAGHRFTKVEQVDEVFDAEKDRITTWIRDGKTVHVV
jgi:hypothetical protein